MARSPPASKEHVTAGKQGTGKHLHKSAKEPYPHNNADGNAHKPSGAKSHDGADRHDDGADLESREFTDEKGNAHHHTRTAGNKG